jgi:hypothetical protein
MTMADWTIAAITIIVVLGVAGFAFTYVRNKNSQVQRVDRGGSAIQSGRDTKIGK